MSIQDALDRLSADLSEIAAAARRLDNDLSAEGDREKAALALELEVKAHRAKGAIDAIGAMVERARQREVHNR
jgi:hypothetical protein